MKEISLTILASVITFSVCAERSPGVSKSDDKELPHLVSYVGVNPLQAASGTERLTKAD